jgi:hypothetical protein
MGGVNFDPQSAARIARVVRTVEAQGPRGPNTDTPISNPDASFWAKLNGEDTSNPGSYNWIAQNVVNGVLQAFSPTIQDNTNYSAADVYGSVGLPTGMYVLMSFCGYDSDGGYAIYNFAAAMPGTHFQVALTQSGGSAGANNSSVCSFTYTVKNLFGAGILSSTAISPGSSFARLYGEVLATAATTGWGHYALDGTFVLDWANEKIASGACS